jgi:hypothetical protein
MSECRSTADREAWRGKRAVARALAEHACACASSDYALATTGVAGPRRRSPEKPVGTVYIALAASGRNDRKKVVFSNLIRETFKQIATLAALELLRRKLLRHRTLSFPSEVEVPRSTAAGLVAGLSRLRLDMTVGQ